MSSVAAPIPATDVGYDGVRLLDLDFERRNERILGLDENVQVRLTQGVLVNRVTNKQRRGNVISLTTNRVR